MIIRRETLQAVLQATMKVDHTQIQITPGGEVVATNGHLLLVAKEPHRFPDEDFPSRDVPEYHGAPAEPVTIDRVLVERLLRALPKRVTIPILGAAQLGTNGERAYIAATDLVAPIVLHLPPQSEQAGGFPSWQRVLPNADRPAIQITLSAEILQALAKAAVLSAGDQQTPCVTFYIPTEPQYQGFDTAKALANGCQLVSNILVDKHGQAACCRDYPNRAIESAIRVEITGRDVELEGAVAPSVRRKREK